MRHLLLVIDWLLIDNFLLSAIGQLKARLTIKVPYTQRYYQVGIERNLALELPIRVVAEKKQGSAIQFAVTPTHLENNGKPSGEIRVVSYDQLPYTAVIKDPWAKTLSQKYESFDLIRTGKPSQSHSKVGREELGLSFVYENEYDRAVRGGAAWNYVLYKNMNVTFDLTNSRTNTVLFTFALGRASQLSASSTSGSSSSSNEGSIETGPKFEHGLVLAAAITGKAGVVQPISQKATTIDEIDNKNAKNIFQYLAITSLSTDMDAGFVRLARGKAADKVATTMPQGGGLRIVREAITESDTSSQQGTGCVEVSHKVQDVSQNSMFGKSECNRHIS